MANLFYNFCSEALIHENSKKDGSGSVMNISIPVASSKTGYGSFAVNPGQVLAATKKDGTVVDGYRSILLGAADKTRKVSICTRAGGKKPTYKVIEMTNQEILDTVTEARKAYVAAQATDAE